MSRRRCRVGSAGLMAIALLIAAPSARAQAPNEPQHPAEPGAATPETSNDTAEKFPILAISSVEILRSEHPPATDIVLVRGLTSAEDWTDGELVPLTRGAAPDGVLDLVFVAEAPQETVTPTRYEPILAILPIAADHPFKAVRVRSATNSVVVKNFPGYVEAKAPPEPCTPCVGKHFVPRGGTAPAGVAEADVVRQEDLPSNVRVLLPSDGIADMRPNPNRLTIVVGEDGRIVDAELE